MTAHRHHRTLASRRRRPLARRSRCQRGFTLIELLISASLGITLTMIGFSVLYFTQTNVTRVDEQVNIDQTGRIVLENLMLELHSGCVAPESKPIQSGSTETTVKFVNARSEAPRTEGESEAHTKPYLHEVIYEEAKEKLYEKKVLGTESPAGSGSFVYTGTPTERVLALHVRKTESGGTKQPIFRYYRYFEEGDAGYEAGRLNETALEVPLSSEAAKKNYAGKVAKVTVGFSVAPRAKNLSSKALEAVALEDSAVYRLTPVSTAESSAPAPCA
jgi:prepilin-type N-terminal cleavage/methylation domain-containing protein